MKLATNTPNPQPEPRSYIEYTNKGGGWRYYLSPASENHSQWEFVALPRPNIVEIQSSSQVNGIKDEDLDDQYHKSSLIDTKVPVQDNLPKSLKVDDDKSNDTPVFYKRRRTRKPKDCNNVPKDSPDGRLMPNNAPEQYINGTQHSVPDKNSKNESPIVTGNMKRFCSDKSMRSEGDKESIERVVQCYDINPLTTAKGQRGKLYAVCEGQDPHRDSSSSKESGQDDEGYDHDDETIEDSQDSNVPKSSDQSNNQQEKEQGSNEDYNNELVNGDQNEHEEFAVPDCTYSTSGLSSSKNSESILNLRITLTTLIHGERFYPARIISKHSEIHMVPTLNVFHERFQNFDYHVGFKYRRNLTFGLNRYEPVGYKVCSLKRGYISIISGLCPYCETHEYVPMRNAHYRKHLLLVHGIYDSNGGTIQDPIDYYSAFIQKHPETSEAVSAREVVGCPYCPMKVMLCKQFRNAFLEYFMHYAKCHSDWFRYEPLNGKLYLLRQDDYRISMDTVYRR